MKTLFYRSHELLKPNLFCLAKRYLTNQINHLYIFRLSTMSDPIANHSPTKMKVFDIQVTSIYLIS